MEHAGAHQRDLTQGSIFRKLVVVAVPIMGTSLLQMAYNLTDMFWLGRGVSSEAVAAVGSAGMFFWLAMALIMIGSMGAQIGVSQNLGAKNIEAAQRYAHSAVFLSLVLGIVYGALLGFGADLLISLFNIREAHVAAEAAGYLRMVAVAVPPWFMTAAMTGAFNASGNTHLSFMAHATGLITNMVLDPLFILVFRWGVLGGALATALAELLVFALMCILMKRHKSRPFAQFHLLGRPHRAEIRQILRWSIPSALESGLFTLLAMTIARRVASFGAGAIAAQQMGTQIESLAWLVGGGFGTAVTTFVGQNYGAGKWTRIHRGFRISMAAMLVYGLFVSLLLFFGGRALISLFLREEPIRDIGGTYLRVLATCEWIACTEATTGGTFRGIGKTVPPAVCSILSNIARVPLAYALAATVLGLNGIWWAIACTCMVRGLAMLVWYLVQAKQLPRVDVAQMA